MNHVDIILAIPLTIGAIRGFTRGFFREIASLVGVVLGAIIAAYFGQKLSDLFVDLLSWDAETVKIIAFIVIFIIVIIIVKLIARLFEKMFKAAGINVINRVVGLAAGTLKVAFIISILLIFFEAINDDGRYMSAEIRDESFLYLPVAGLAPRLLPEGDLSERFNFGRKEN